MSSFDKEITLTLKSDSSPALRTRRLQRKHKLIRKDSQRDFKDYSIENIQSTFDNESADSGCKDNDPNKRYKTRDEISFLEKQLILDPSWSRKTVQLCKRTLGMRTDQIYKWGYDRKKAMRRYSKLYPESNGIKARFAKVDKRVNKNNMNDVVDNIIDSMKHYKIYNQSAEDLLDDESDVETQPVIFHFDELDEQYISQKKEICKEEYFSEPLGLNEFSMRLTTFDCFNEELYLTLSRENNFF